MIIGSSAGVHDQIVAALGPSYQFRGVRRYAGGGALGNDAAVNIFPAPWPVHGAGTRTLLSVYPDLTDLLAGRLDEQIRHMIADAPAGSILNAWHEVLSLPYTQSYLTPDNVYQMHCRMDALCQGSNVTYGCLLGGGDLAELMRNVPPDLGYYGLDLYGNLDIRTTPRWRHPRDRWTQFTELAKAKDQANGNPWLVIGETNCPDRSLRPDWFKLIASLMHDYGQRAMALMTFWSGQGNLSGPWDPADTATTSALRDICSRYAT